MKKLIAAFFSVLIISTSAFSAEKKEENIGLCLAGGGAKGAYEAGVWMAFKQMELDKNITAISGTSVGALNAALFPCVSSYRVKKLWKNEIGFTTVLTPDLDKYTDMIQFIADYCKVMVAIYKEAANVESLETDGQIYEVFEQAGADLLKTLGKYFRNFLLTDSSSKGLFSRTNLLEIIEDNITLEKIKNNPIKIYATCLRKKNLFKNILLTEFDGYKNRTDTFLLNEQTSMENISKILLASSAMPLVFDTVNLPASIIVDGEEVGRDYEYVDGGFERAGGDNVPVTPLLDDPEITTVIVVYLGAESEIGNVMYSNLDIDLQGKRMIEIVPSQPLGDLVHGTLNFSGDQIERLVEMGYKDARRVLKQYY